MKQVLIIPDKERLEQSLVYANQYNLGFEYNDFFAPDLLDDKEKLEKVIECYKEKDMPDYCTVHGAFFDVIPFSLDEKIKEVSRQRIEASIEIAERLNAKAVVFHTNYNPFLNTQTYIKNWIKENLSFWSSVLEKHTGIEIYLENMFDTTPEILAALSEGLSHYPNYGVCLDYAHAVISPTEPKEWVKCLGKYVKHVHINDNDLISDLHLPWGKGKINRTAFYELYETYMKDATILIETTSPEDGIASLQRMLQEGFLTK